MSYVTDAEYDSWGDDEERAEAHAICMGDPEYAWKWRVVQSVEAKAAAIRACHRQMGITDNTEVVRLYRSVAKLADWCQEYLEEEMSNAREEAAEQRDPYGYRGLSRKDFL